MELYQREGKVLREQACLWWTVRKSVGKLIISGQGYQLERAR